MSGLRVTRLMVANVGPLLGEIDLGELDSGLTLITGDNETGKTTVVEAMRAALFENHAARHQRLKDLQPHGTRLAPEVRLGLRVGDVEYTLHKRFLEKPVAELVEVGGGGIWTGADAEERLQELLQTRPAGPRGAKPEHRGVWGLLWVTQDEAAFTDPGKELPPEVRGRLQDAIGRQVSTVLGGPGGERLRRRIAERHARYFTRTGKETGDLADARQAAAAAVERVGAIEAALATVEDQGRQRDAARNKLGRLDADRLGRLNKLEQARQAAADARTMRAEAEAAANAAQAAAHLGDRAARAWQERRELVQAEDEAATAAQAGEAALEGLRVRLAERQAAAAARKRLRLAEAEALAVRLEDAAEGLTEQALAELRALDGATRARLAELEAVGTRLRVTTDDGVWVAAFGRRRTVDAPGLGEVTVTPAREGLAEAVRRAQEGRSRLAEALRAAGAEDADQARAARKERVRVEVDAERVEERLAERAPDGVAALAEAVGELRAAVQESERAQAKVEALQGRRAALDEDLAGNPLTPAALDRLRDLDRRAAVARSAANAAAPTVEVLARADVAVEVDEADPASLSAGEALTVRPTARTTLRIGEAAEVTVTPGGEDLTRAAAEAEALGAERDELLAGLGAADLAAADERGRAWREADAERNDVAGRLEDLAEAAKPPPGDLSAAERGLKEARELDGTLKELRAKLEGRPVTDQALERIERLERELTGLHATVDERVASLSGPAAIGEVRAASRHGADGWELVPGEGGEEADAAWARACEELDAALRSAGVADLHEAERAARRGDERRLLEHLAPEGLEALREAVAALGEAGEAEEAGEASGEPAADAERQAEVFAEQVKGQKQAQAERDGRRKELAERLAEAREQASDETLEAEADQAAAKAGASAAAAAEAEAAAVAGSAELLGDDLERAEEVVGAAERRGRELRDRITELDVLMGLAAERGHFEELGEARAALDAAVAALDRVEADAAATRLLHDTVEAAHAESQRRFLAPVVEEATPYLHLIRPGSKLKMSPDLTVDEVVDAGGAGEAWERLSGGTREQLSVIVRLALARVLARDQRPLPLVLDDTLGWTDQSRLLQMARILRDASRELQVIVLTCHPERFEDLGAPRTIPLDRLAREAREAREAVSTSA